MKKYSFEKRIDKSITEVKVYLLLLAQGHFEQEINDIVNTSLDVRQLRKKIRKREDIALAIFMKMKKALDSTDSFNVLEEHLIYMNLLLDPLFPPVSRYKNQLFQYIINNYDFTVATYCILRHLITFKRYQVSEFVKYMCKRTFKSTQEYHYIAAEIACIEHLYDDAYDHLRYIPLNGGLQSYKFALYQYSSYKFKKIIENRRNPFLQLLFNK